MEQKMSMTIAVRAYPLPVGTEPYKPSRRRWRRPEAMLVIDTETRTDAAQGLTFASYRFIDQGDCVEEGLIYADDLPDDDRAVLGKYAATHDADVAPGEHPQLRLRSRTEFMDAVFFEAAYKARALVVGFNLPFDLSRLGMDVTAARDRYAGGFSIGFWSYADAGRQRRDRFRPRLVIKHVDSKRALMAFTASRQIDPHHRIPYGSTSGQPVPQYTFHGHFLDLRTLAFALTNGSHSLESACEAFRVEHRKLRATAHGVVTPEYIDYNRRDVLATCELTFKLLAEYDTHPIALQVTKAFSPASIGKAYLRAMGIDPILERQPDFPVARLGHAQSAFFGGRAGAHIRKVVVPVVYTDFLSMYPSVNSLMGLWRFVTAKRIRVIDGCADDINTFLRKLRVDDLFTPETWPKLTGFVRLVPNGDILPTRGQYGEGHDWQIGINHLHGSDRGRDDALWFALPDVAASVLLAGRVPVIVDAFRIEANGVADTLTPTALGGRIPIDPRDQDFFKAAIEERKRVGMRRDWPEAERERIAKALKVLANAASYGIYAEMHRQETDAVTEVRCHGIDPTPFTCRVRHPEVPGEYCFPPLASLITAAARLMLALLEHAVTSAGGTYAMEDTDSMAIVATESGGLVACPGGPHRLADGREAVLALSWAQVRAIAERFAALNPYDRSAVPGSVLKIEGDNFDPQTEKQRQLYCLAISAKRYALFVQDGNGALVLTKCSEHGLGHLRNPTDLDAEDRDWIAQAWLNIVRRALGLNAAALRIATRPAIGRVTISSPAVMRPLARLNDRKPYAAQLKPFNFLLTCHVRPFGRPEGADPERFHLIAPYEADATRWTAMDWIDQYTGATYRITTEGYHGSRGTARVKTYGDVLEEYEWHPESKCADAAGAPADRQTIGLLQRRHVHVAAVKYIGKESNHLEEVESGLMRAADSVYTAYPDPRRDPWRRVIAPALKQIPLNQFERLTGKSRRILIDAPRGRRRPHRRHQELLISIARRLGLL